jgi:hypothetical protein
LIIFATERWPDVSSGRVDSEHLDGGRRVDVLALLERLAQLRLAGDVREGCASSICE